MVQATTSAIRNGTNRPAQPFAPERPAPERPTPGRIRVLGEWVDLVTPDEVLRHVEAAAQAGRRSVIANHNLNSLNLIRSDPAMRAFYDAADLVEIDSTPLIAFARLLGLPARRAHRCTYLDWREAFWRLADRSNWRVFYLGGAPGVADSAAQSLSGRHPGVRFATRDGYFDAADASADNEAVLARIRDFAPHVLMVGMGMPRQEAWAARNLESLPNCVIFTVGAAFDYEAGVQAAAPRWMGQAGLEWLYRLARDPRRLFRRYCVEPWSLAGPALRDVVAALTGRLERG